MIVEGRPDEEEEVIDKYIKMNLIFDVRTNNERCGTMVKRSRGLDGIAINRSHANSLFDTREHEIEFMDETRDKYTDNLIAENMYAQVDDEGHQFQLLADIQDHQKDGTVI